MVQEITQDVKTLDYAKRHLTYSVTVLKRLQMLGKEKKHMKTSLFAACDLFEKKQ